ncbi:MAG TPA: RraA family protein [Opitutaceae bacterium]|nr:RraA family protein [Opitutaceae bacterium]
MKLANLIEELSDFDTALLANTIGYLDPTPPHEWYMGRTIASCTPAVGPTVGVAMTLEIDTSSPGNRPEPENYYRLLRAIEREPTPVVLVIKAVGRRPDHECVLGDGMAKMLHSVGCVGVVTDGGVRDLEGIRTIPFGVYAHGLVVHHCAPRYVHYNRPVEVGGIRVEPGQLIHANVGGVIRIPRAVAPRLPVAATMMRAFEYEAHRIFRRTDLSITRKRREVEALVAGLKWPAVPRRQRGRR